VYAVLSWFIALLLGTIDGVLTVLNVWHVLQQEEEIQNLQKQIQQLEGDLDTAQTQLAEATTKLENTEKELSKVRLLTTRICFLFSFHTTFTVIYSYRHFPYRTNQDVDENVYFLGILLLELHNTQHHWCGKTMTATDRN